MASQERLIEIARNVIWFEKAEQVISNTDKFLAYAMKYAMLEEIKYLLNIYGKDAFLKALDSDYHKILDNRSKAYFELILKGKSTT